jgi:ABC-2 type transport system permease protein
MPSHTAGWPDTAELTLLVSFAYGVVISSAAAIVAFFMYSFVIPPLLGLLAVSKEWFTDVRPWVDVDHQVTALPSGGFEPAVAAVGLLGRQTGSWSRWPSACGPLAAPR